MLCQEQLQQLVPCLRTFSLICREDPYSVRSAASEQLATMTRKRGIDITVQKIHTSISEGPKLAFNIVFLKISVLKHSGSKGGYVPQYLRIGSLL